MRLLAPLLILFAALGAPAIEWIVFGPPPTTAPAMDCETDAQCESACLATATDCPYPY